MARQAFTAASIKSLRGRFQRRRHRPKHLRQVTIYTKYTLTVFTKRQFQAEFSNRRLPPRSMHNHLLHCSRNSGSPLGEPGRAVELWVRPVLTASPAVGRSTCATSPFPTRANTPPPAPSTSFWNTLPKHRPRRRPLQRPRYHREPPPVSLSHSETSPSPSCP